MDYAPIHHTSGPHTIRAASLAEGCGVCPELSVASSCIVRRCRRLLTKHCALRRSSLRRRDS
ncbi:uncharacterized protein B0H18DRAFT_991823 [Fomitopsis serialis]|uniref:uncharacterized protein n=1 Tax=Fomitopsis serialis TaxID=139415 RepID=UPI002008459A|nr:uncharacterized protein B0H18DRAFT_991823 [Neoantrodia serialis]KAH9930917.1 hypothetical protein B0H18DRAFT_991823 [Neoantrodia serialis]